MAPKGNKMRLFKIHLQKGDLIDVLPLEEIEKTLDNEGKCENLIFMPGMKKYAGKRHRVLRRAQLIYNESLNKMVRMKNTVLLEDAICDGKDSSGIEQCQRLCFYYWKEHWLKKVT